VVDLLVTTVVTSSQKLETIEPRALFWYLISLMYSRPMAYLIASRPNGHHK